MGLNGSDAIETAIKFAIAATGRPRIVAFEGSYHGLSTGALEVTAFRACRAPFEASLKGLAVFLPYPTMPEQAPRVLEALRRLARAKDAPCGAIIFEPIQGRGGIRVPAPGFLKAMANLAQEEGVLLIADEIYTGVGRTGTFLACEHEAIVPDILCLGKALGGGVPLSVCLMRPEIAHAIQPISDEAPHTWTFLGHPLGCAAGMAVLREIRKRNLLARAEALGEQIFAYCERWRKSYHIVKDVRGRGAMLGIELAYDNGQPAAELARKVVKLALERGVILGLEGEAGNVLAITPPLVIQDADLKRAMGIVESCLMECLQG